MQHIEHASGNRANPESGLQRRINRSIRELASHSRLYPVGYYGRRRTFGYVLPVIHLLRS
jgi:hypothetical protein